MTMTDSRDRKVFSPTGTNLGVNRLVRFARNQCGEFTIPDDRRARIEEARRIVSNVIERGDRVYGVTTGLGARAGHVLSREQLTEFSYQTLRGRAQSVGSPLSPEITRGAMIARLNTMMTGASGGSASVAEFLVDCLNRGITPVVGNMGSIGASDLCLGATMGLALVGEGRMFTSSGRIESAASVLESEAMPPLRLGPKDGLVLANHACFTASMAAFAVDDANTHFNLVQSCAAMTMEAMKANLSPILESVVSQGQHDGQRRAARHLERLLKGSSLEDCSQAARVQDPLSIRNGVQVHGSLLSAVTHARSTVNAELNTVTDNPVVDIESGQIISSGGYFSSELLLCLESLARAIDMTLTMQVARLSKLASSRFSGLPQFLARESYDSNGFAPVLKIAEALLGSAKRALGPVALWPSINADGVEDALTNAFERGQSLRQALEYGRKLSAIEMIMAAQALELSGRDNIAPEAIVDLLRSVRGIVPPLDSDRPMGNDIEELAAAVSLDSFSLLDHAGG
jgi:histidine ammonia-lyase